MDNQLLDNYLSGALEIDINKLPIEFRQRYRQQKELLNQVLKEINEFIYSFAKIKRINEVFNKQNEEVSVP